MAHLNHQRSGDEIESGYAFGEAEKAVRDIRRATRRQYSQIVAGTALADNGTVFNHACAIVTLANAARSINYYQFDSTDATPGNPPAPTALAYSDNVAAPRAA